MQLRRLGRSVAGLGLVLAALAGWRMVRPYHPEPWLADLAQLERATADGYANLEDAVASGRVDPVSLHRQTLTAIRQAGSDREAARALRRFTDAFGDAHYHAIRATPEWVSRVERWVRGRGGRAVTPELGAGAACGRLGYRDDGDPSLLSGEREYRALDPAPFATGILQAGGHPVGLVRIPLFDARRYGTVCRSIWPGYRTRLAPGRPCDERCQDEFQLEVTNALLGLLDRRLTRLSQAGAEAVVVDLTGNGGGNDWVDPAARLFSNRPLLGGRQEWIRHPHVIGPLTAIQARIRADRSRSILTDRQRRMLDSAAGAVAARIAEARTGCDRRAIWTEGPAGVSCSLLLTTPAYTTGLLAYAAPGELDGLQSAGDLFTASDYRYREGAWTGPVLVLVDHRTASAAEYFAALLRDNGAARIIGEPTLGAGCGYTYGGIGEVLHHSGLTLYLPDCLRRRRNGANEQNGVTPDLSAGWTPDASDAERREQAVLAVARALGD